MGLTALRSKNSFHLETPSNLDTLRVSGWKKNERCFYDGNIRNLYLRVTNHRVNSRIGWGEKTEICDGVYYRWGKNRH